MSAIGRITLRCCLLSLAVLALLLTTSGKAEAMICDADVEAEDESRWSSQLPPLEVAVARKPAKQPPQRCESFGDVDCDLGIPSGEPKAPRPLQTRRPVAALASGALPPTAPRSVRHLLARTATTNSSDFLDDIFRPPRRS